MQELTAATLVALLTGCSAVSHPAAEPTAQRLALPTLEIHKEVLEPGWHLSLLLHDAELSVITVDQEGAEHRAWSKILDAHELAGLQQVLQLDAIRLLGPSYVAPGVQDGSATHIFIRTPGRPAVYLFVQNQRPPALEPLSSALLDLLPPDLDIAAP